ncbi:unnamed protein product [Adineta steineri]|uniref:NHL repeat containing protein n=3 Tax=Adineta steineri TaxID=433720 RepID=A0A819XWG3_9BILA|nr:unnamed protein product [Adineta steineri]CAF4142779.1 unnamed protein product [Adineta steineri]
MFWLVFILSLFSVCNSILITKIKNNIIIGIMYNDLFNITENQCICEMIKVNDSISALNYFSINQTCQLFRSNASTIYIEFYSNSTFIFLNQSSITILNVQEYQPSTSSLTPTTTSSTSTSATTLVNPCISGGYRWNTTGTTILNSTQITHAAHLFFDSNDTLYVVDEYANSVIWKLPKNAVNPILVAGQALSRGPNFSQLNLPQAVYLDSEQNLYVTDYYNYRVQKYINGSNIGMTIIGINGTAGTASSMLGGPRHLCFDSTETYMYIADSDNNRIMRFQSNSTSGTNGHIVAGGNGAGNGTTQLNYPWGIHYLSSVSSYLYITNYYGHTVMQWAPGNTSGSFIAGTPGVSGSNATLLNNPIGIKIDTYLNIFVVDYGNSRVQLFCNNNQTGTTIIGTGTAGASAQQLNNPRGIVFDSLMNMYIADSGNQRVQKYLKL